MRIVVKDNVMMNLSVQTAMIIDDDPDLSHLLAGFLEARKIHVLATQTLAEAESYLSYLKPTVVFLDNSFPEGLGINFIHNIKSADEEIKIIMMTADVSQWIEQKAKDEGINYFLKKPFTKKALDFVLDKLQIGKPNSNKAMSRHHFR